jgi:hypothetical protein
MNPLSRCPQQSSARLPTHQAANTDGIGITRRSEQSRLCRPRNSLDLLFYHLKLRCYVVIELKAGKFKPEHLSQLSFYLTAVDEQVKHPQDGPTIGLLLCKSKNKVVAEYALRNVNKPLGVADYQLVESLPPELQTSLPSIEQIENELAGRHPATDGER